MAVVAWRVVAERYTLPPYNPFDGKGAARVGGRWNSPGTAVAYLSGNLSLAVLEVLVHSAKLDSLADKMVIALTFSDQEITTIDPAKLPTGWAGMVTEPLLRGLGDHWYQGLKTPVLRMPSAVIPIEFNYLLNPAHPRSADIIRTATAKQPLPLDTRLFQIV